MFTDTMGFRPVPSAHVTIASRGHTSSVEPGRCGMTDGVQMRVAGTPIPQGSKQARMRRNRSGIIWRNGMPIIDMTDANSNKLRPWRRTVAAIAAATLMKRQEQGLAALDGPLHLSVAFRFQMPKSRKAGSRRRGWQWRATKPDLDKLVRAICDALETDAHLITEDSRIASLAASKVETVNTHDVGCTIHLWTLDCEGEPAKVSPLDPRGERTV